MMRRRVEETHTNRNAPLRQAILFSLMCRETHGRNGENKMGVGRRRPRTGDRQFLGWSPGCALRRHAAISNSLVFRREDENNTDTQEVGR